MTGGTAPDAPPGEAIAAVFGTSVPLASHYAELLCGDGVEHGLLGPREVDRLWTRHLLNCAVVTDLVPADARVVDVGSGAGLPGLAMAIRRPDLRLVLVEPMQRRIDFLERCVQRLGLRERVEVVRGRAGERGLTRSWGQAGWVTARAVAPLDRLVRWCLPLLADDGVLLALKGERALDEVRQHEDALRRSGARVRSVEELPVADDVTRVVVVTRSTGSSRPRGARQGGR